MAEDTYPVRWAGSQAVVVLPGRIDAANAGEISGALLRVIGRGAAELVVDMTVTTSCDHDGAEALVRAYQRAIVNGTELLLVVTATAVRRVLSLSGLDRLVAIHPSLKAATAVRAPRVMLPVATPDGPGAAMSAAVLWKVIDALHDGVALADDEGILALANRRLEEMFGYGHAELAGHTVESLVPADLRPAHRSYRAGYARAPRARPMGAGARLVGLRKDGGTFPVEVSLSPVPTTTRHLTLAVVRDITEARRAEDLAGIARAAAAAGQEHSGRQLLDRVTGGLFRVGLSLQAAAGLPADAAGQAITQAIHALDETLREIRDAEFAAHHQGTPPAAAPPDGA